MEIVELYRVSIWPMHNFLKSHNATSRNINDRVYKASITRIALIVAPSPLTLPFSPIFLCDTVAVPAELQAEYLK